MAAARVLVQVHATSKVQASAGGRDVSGDVEEPVSDPSWASPSQGVR